MKIFIPEIGTELKLDANWTFKLYNEDRNRGILERMGLEADYSPRIWDPENSDREYLKERIEGRGFKRDLHSVSWGSIDRWVIDTYVDCTLLAGTVLKIDRIYIRKGKEEYSSLTFFIIDSPDPLFSEKKGPKRRFWAKLDDVKEIEI